MPSFKHTLLGNSKLCNQSCRVLLTNMSSSFLIFKPNTIILRSWQVLTGDKLWRFFLSPSFPTTLPIS
jgi:hypothetical protein